MDIKVRELIQSDAAISTISGNKVYQTIIEDAKTDSQIILDFSELTLINTAFLNNAIGKLFSNDNYKEGKFQVILRNFPEDLMGMLKECVRNAQHFA